MKRIYSNNVQIDNESLKGFYKDRAKNKLYIDIDAPVVLCGDENPSKIGEWTDFEVKNRLPLLELKDHNVVLEVGCGTGRISKYIIPNVNTFVGVEYVKEFIDLIQCRQDIVKKENIYFVHSSFQQISEDLLKNRKKFDRFVISGGVLMYINDDEIKKSLNNLVHLLDKDCIVYISEPIALKERLTLNKFYAANLKSEYSAIYRTEQEYHELFSVFYDNGFELKVSEEFFQYDIKDQKETKQWMFLMNRVK